MIKTPLFKRFFWLLTFVALLNYIAIKLYLYWSDPDIDMVVHSLAGVTVGMATVLMYGHFNNFLVSKKFKVIAIAVVSTLIVGILWEIYELYFGLTFLSDGMAYVRDTASDVTMDLIGGYVGGWYSVRLMSKNK